MSKAKASSKKTYTITISGYGGETFAGKVNRKAYDYFKDHKIDLNDYINEEVEVPEEFQPFEPAAPFDCDDIFHFTGSELAGSTILTVSDSSGKVIFEHNLDPMTLSEAGIAVEEEDEEYYVEGFLEPNEVALYGQYIEKGAFFDEILSINEPFDPSKLELRYTDFNGWDLVSGVFYNGETVEIENGASTDSKSNELKWVLGENVESYDPVEKPKVKKTNKKK